MNNFLNNLNTREKNLIFIALFLIAIAALFFLINNTFTNLNFSSKQLDKAKSDYELSPFYQKYIFSFLDSI